MSLVQALRARAGQGLIIASMTGLPAFSSQADAQQFGRFFTTPEQRQGIDEARKTGSRQNRPVAHDAVAVEEHPAAKAPPAIDTITLKGIIYRQGKTGVAWVSDNHAHGENLSLDYLELELDDAQILDNNVSIELPATGQAVKLKPGQSYDLQSGAIFDVTEEPP